MRRGTASLVVAGVLLVGGCTGVPVPEETVHAEARLTVSEPAELPLPRERAVQVDPLRPDRSSEAVHSSGPTSASSLLSGLLAQDERFGTVWLDRSGTLVLVWHGDPPLDALASVAVACPEVPVRVESLSVLPGELREIAASLLADERFPEIRAASVREDFSSIVVQVDTLVPNHLTLAERLTAAVGFPVEVQGSS